MVAHRTKLQEFKQTNSYQKKKKPHQESPHLVKIHNPWT